MNWFKNLFTPKKPVLMAFCKWCEDRDELIQGKIQVVVTKKGYQRYAVRGVCSCCNRGLFQFINNSGNLLSELSESTT